MAQLQQPISPDDIRDKMTSNIDHILLTRFNLPSAGVERLIRAKDGWLRDRVELFEKYCLPSVAAQTEDDFKWIVYFDPESPPWLQERIRSYESILTPIFRASVNNSELVADLRTVTGARRPFLLTTNLDNDDGLAADFVARLQGTAIPDSRHALYLTRGLIVRGTEVYLRTDRNNAFCSVHETWMQPATCWADWHNRLGKSMPVREIQGQPAWLQVIHGSNVSNRVRGRLVSPDRYEPDFPTLGSLPAPSPGAYLRDRLVAQPERLLKESGRRLAKEAAFRLLGKNGFNKAKLLLARRMNISRDSGANMPPAE